MKDLIMFNHGVFQQELQDKLEELHHNKALETDPYKQWNYDEQIKLVSEILVKYKKSVDQQLNR